MEKSSQVEVAWSPLFVDGDDDAGWVIVYEHTKTKQMRESSEVFDTEEEALQCLKKGGDLSPGYTKMIEEVVGKAAQCH